ncbi:uncharacterized protein LOC126853627 isoform X2 [Cataglyphis hispanica]|uniref:uncharacterized protein LOC126853627 isoform X2 n=1 Tax=Cataglyphis hispanica TaxID=1086592 RepID=UPI00218008E0|nr:uncharacterized protein LOC126853627 isoform X2 [Cataglyphis hispanica]
MRPTAARSNRSSVHHPRSSPIPSPSTTSVYHQPQQQQILYAPISNPMVTLQPCGTVLHPSCVYPNVQSHVGSSNSAALHLQGKNNRWHSKNKSSRGQLCYQQQQPLSCNAKPVALLDQPSSSIAPIPSSTTSFLVASSTFAHAGPLSSEHYNNNSRVTHLLPQSFNFKPSNVQTFCLIQDRQNAQQQHPIQASYYNISATNTCSLQTINPNSSFPLPSLNPYTNLTTFNSNQFPATVQSSPLFTNSPVGLVLAPTQKNKFLPTSDFSSLKNNASKTTPRICESRIVPVSHSDNFNGWPLQIETSAKNSCDAHTAGNSKDLESTDHASQKPISAKTDEEHYSDESSNSFDFTIEAEKMVSALCNTTSSNDLGKEESKPDNKTDSAPLFSGAGDNVSNKANWFTDFCSEYENGTSIGVQTDAYPCADRSQYPELIRKTVYWGCTEAEIVLGSNDSHTDSKQSWLTCLSSATRTAITKSSTCIPVFAGDRVLANDLINALLRISNGWLSLDNYLNKQHFPNLIDRLEPELISCFYIWEESTCELLKQIVRTFQKFGENNEKTDQKCNAICGSSSFPGDVSLYTNYNLFAQPSSSSFIQNTVRKVSSQENPPSATSIPLSTSSLHNFQYNSGQQEQQSAAQKESKLRSKWTITENLSSAINTTKSVPNVSIYHMNDVNSLANTKLRTKNASSASRKSDSIQKSLNAEFYQLKNKVMESSTDTTKDRKHDFKSENKLLTSHSNTDQSIRMQHSATNTPLTYNGLYAQNCLSFTFPLSNNPSSSYPVSNPGILTYGGYLSSRYSYPITDINSRSNRNSEQNYGTKSAKVHPTYVGKSQTDQIEFPAVPRNKMTLLSQIEPRTFDKESKEMAANLSAWFASMRNAQSPAASTFEESKMNENLGSRLFAQQEISKYSMSVPKQPQIDANRQFQALQNLPNIQSTPWAASNFINRYQAQHAPEEYDSSEDVRVYMKPGSYNVPRKRHQRRFNRRSDNSNATSRNATNNHHNVCGNKGKGISILASSTPLSHINAPTTNISNATLIKTSFPPASQLPAPLFNLENSPRILKRTESSSQDAHQDVTWKAACASAEILLEALNVKDCSNTCRKIDCNDNTEKDNKNKENAETSQQSDLKLLKRNNVDYASSYEASEDDSGSTCRLSPSTSVLSASQLREEENALGIRTNVKTDSWLIRTLNNASIVGKQKRHKDDIDPRSLESSNSSETADVKLDQFATSSTADADTKTPAIIIDSEYPAIFSREHISGFFSRNDQTLTKESESYVGRATYSETVRRSIKTNNVPLERKETCKPCTINSSVATVIPIPGRKCQRKDPEQSYQLLHKSRKSADKKTVRNTGGNDLQLEEGSCAKINSVKSNNIMSKLSITTKTHGKKDLEHSKDKYAIKSSDRGWSVWYSSRKKQTLSSLALSKLETIHQTVWQMDEAKIFKYPFSCDNKDGQSLSAEIMEDYCKVVKSPMFLEIVEYKLKNRIYHKVEHAVKDFRRIIHNARLYHQHDDEQTKKIEILSKKLEDLLEEHFDNWDFENITESPREDSSMQLRLKTIGQKPNAGCCDSAKKGTSSLANVENSSFH